MTVCLTGYPLSGKTTLARDLAGTAGLERFSTGDCARRLGMAMEDSIATMDLSASLDGQITAAAVEAARRGCLLDGFPRSLAQVQALRDAGLEFRVVFVTLNPLKVYDRVADRARAQGRPEDRPDVVAGRLKRSMEFKRELEGALLPGELLQFDADRGFEALREELGV